MKCVNSEYKMLPKIMFYVMQGRHEFYRYMPGEQPPTKIFPVRGMQINVSKIYIIPGYSYMAD